MPRSVSRLRCSEIQCRFGQARRDTGNVPYRVDTPADDEPSALRDRLCFRGGALHARRHLAGDGALFLDRGGGRRDVFTDALDRLLDAVERADDVAGDAVEIADLLPDLVGRLLGL